MENVMPHYLSAGASNVHRENTYTQAYNSIPITMNTPIYYSSASPASYPMNAQSINFMHSQPNPVHIKSRVYVPGKLFHQT